MAFQGILNVAIDNLLNYMFGETTFVLPTTFYIALSTSTPTATGGNIIEPAGNGYSRVAFVNNTTNFPATSTEVSKNNTLISFPQASGAWGTVTNVCIFDAPTGGTCWAVAPLTAPEAITTNMTLQLPIGNLQISMTQGTGPQGFTNYAINALLSYLFGLTAISLPANWYIALSTTVPTASGGNFTEPVGNSYARATVLNSSASFLPATADTEENAGMVSFNSATGTWGNVVYIGICDELTGGNIWEIVPLASPVSITLDMTFELPATNMQVSITQGS